MTAAQSARSAFAALCLVTGAASDLCGQAATPDARDRMAPVALSWAPAPPSLPAGAELAVLQGDPAAAGPFTVRLRMPRGYRIAPHTHGTDLHVTVISGRARLPMVDASGQEVAGAAALRPGDFVSVRAGMQHVDAAVTAAVLQIHGLGPFSITYVDPADDPQRPTAGAGAARP